MSLDYAAYLRSPEWQARRTERLRIDDFRCCRCGAKRRLEVHHLNYTRIGCEDVHRDLVTLCYRCHEYVEAPSAPAEPGPSRLAQVLAALPVLDPHKTPRTKRHKTKQARCPLCGREDCRATPEGRALFRAQGRTCPEYKPSWILADIGFE